jgi:hypothetical protein
LRETGNILAFMQRWLTLPDMSKGRINSDGSMTTASRTLRAAGGSWLTVERAARRNENGVYVVRRSELPADSARPRNAG